MKNRLIILVFFNCWLSLMAIPPQARAKGFVELSEIDPTIMVSVRYCTHENFVGTPVQGYNTHCIIMTRQTAQALKEVQAEVNKDGYCVVVYDAYRPQQAVDHFVRWGKDIQAQTKKQHYYPRVNKDHVFDLGYVYKRSGHSRGSTVDLTLIKKGQSLHPIVEKDCTLLDGYSIKFLDDGTVDMGSSFDLFDEASHFENDLIPAECKRMRLYLKNMMNKHGFDNVTKEWWHFTLKNEPYPANRDDSYFNFPIE